VQVGRLADGSTPASKSAASFTQNWELFYFQTVITKVSPH